MIRLALALSLALLSNLSALAQSSQLAAEHDALRKLKADATEAVNKRDYPGVKKLLHEPFMATFITQDSFTDIDKLKAYDDSLYTREFLRMKKATLAADADELSQIYEGTFAVTRGSTKERYELADGRAFDMKGRWTAVSMKQDGHWKLLAYHSGVNFLDNPVLQAIESSLIWFAAGGGAAGLALGLLAGWFMWRRKSG